MNNHLLYSHVTEKSWGAIKQLNFSTKYQIRRPGACMVSTAYPASSTIWIYS